MGQVDDLWAEQFRDLPPVAYQLRVLLHERWVRFHSLPESKRYAESAEEYEEIFRRWRAVMSAVLGERFWMVVTGPSREERAWLSANLGPGEAIALRASLNPDLKPTALKAFRIEGPLDLLRPWLRRLADDETHNTLYINHAGALVAPYDGGIDVIAASEIARDELKDRYRAWLSTHPKGL